MTVPSSRPQRSESDILKLANFFFPSGLPNVLLLADRGYYLDSIGKKGENDIGVYDDAMFLIVDSKLIKSFNANTDPSKADSNMAMLCEGVYTFRKGQHHPNTPKAYNAFRAFPEGVRLPCTRTQNGKTYKSFCSLINIHHGGFNETTSAGCQTIYPSQYQDFITLAYAALARFKQDKLTYVLTDEATSRMILSK